MTDRAAPIDFYFDFISPYGYLAAARIEEIGAKYGRPVVWRPFLLGVTVLQVMGIKPLMETPLKSDYLVVDRPRMARLLGVPLTVPDLDGVNGVAASRAFYWLAEGDETTAKALARRLLERLWVEGRDIADPGVVADEAAALGVSRETLGDALGDPRVKGLLRSAVDAAVGRKVFGSPFFIVDDQPVWGVDRLWMIEHWLRHGSWERTPDVPL